MNISKEKYNTMSKSEKCSYSTKKYFENLSEEEKKDRDNKISNTLKKGTWHKGKNDIYNQDTLKSMSESHKQEKNGMFKKEHSLETRKIMSEKRSLFYKIKQNRINQSNLRKELYKINPWKVSNIFPNIGTDEKETLDKLEVKFKAKIFRQYQVKNFFLDGYIPELNLAIEIDESHHFNIDGNLYDYDIIRQTEIEKELNCQFLRVKV